MSVYYLDSGQLAVIKRVMKRLYNEMERLSADDRRDLANALDAVVHGIESYGSTEGMHLEFDEPQKEAE
jgi:hypothetical protein